MTDFNDIQVETDALVKGDIQIKQVGFSSIHYGNRGKLGQTTTFNPDLDRNGLWVEGSADGSESGGMFLNGNVMCLWSPGDNDLLRVYDEDDFSQPRMVIQGNGSLALKNFAGQNTIFLDSQNGRITIKDWTLAVPDYVFEPDFKLKPLHELESFILQHKHLPDIPPAREVQQSGVDLAQFSMSLLKKIEELSLYVLEQHKLLAAQGDRLTRLEAAAGAGTAPRSEV